MTYSCVVVGTDGSETAEAAVRYSATVAAADDARLVVVTAYDAPRQTAMAQLAGVESTARGQSTKSVPTDLGWLLTDRGQADRVAQRGREIAHEAGAKKVNVQSEDGDPGEVLIEAARFFDADLMVVGSVGLTGVSRLLIGSVATAVLHHAPCDVLVVDTTSS